MLCSPSVDQEEGSSTAGSYQERQLALFKKWVLQEGPGAEPQQLTFYSWQCAG